MRSVVWTAILAIALWVATPVHAVAQDPEPVPVPAPAPRDVAVPRTERVRMRDTETDGRAASEGARRAAPAPAVSRANASSATSANASSADEGEQRRGAVRRPPAGGSSAGAGSRSASDDRSASRGGNRVETEDRPSGRVRDVDNVLPVDRAVPRSSVPRQDHIYYVFPPAYYSPYYDPWGYGAWGPGFAYYSPWGWGPGWYGAVGYGYGGYGPGVYGHGYDIGSVKLKVKPRDAEVYVDNYFAGYVDDFDGTFQSLKVETGGHRIEVRKPGFETLQFDVHVQPDRSVTFRGEMKPTP